MKDMTADELRTRITVEDESRYVVVDVRQPLEYQSGHIPGARLIPLTEIDLRSEELARLGDRNVVFYCRSGHRSLRAARFAAEALLMPDAYHLVGGILAYQGRLLDGFPELEVVDTSEGISGLLHSAINLEKGTQRFYAALAQHLRGTPEGDLILELERAEVAHARWLFDALLGFSGRPERDFEQVYASLEGTRTESGAPVAAAVERGRVYGQEGTLALLEMALELELRAYEVYKNLAGEVADQDLRTALVGLAQEEKHHVERVADRMGELEGGGAARDRGML